MFGFVHYIFLCFQKQAYAFSREESWKLLALLRALLKRQVHSFIEDMFMHFNIGLAVSYAYFTKILHSLYAFKEFEFFLSGDVSDERFVYSSNAQH